MTKRTGLRAVPDDPMKALLVGTPGSGGIESKTGSPSIDLTQIGFVLVDGSELESQFQEEDRIRLGPPWRYAFGW